MYQISKEIVHVCYQRENCALLSLPMVGGGGGLKSQRVFPVSLLNRKHIKIRIQELLHDVIIFVVLYLESQLIQGNLNLALNIINSIFKHFETILLHLSLI